MRALAPYLRLLRVGTLFSPGADVDDDVEVGPHASIGIGARVRGGCIIQANVVIGDGCELGEGCIIGPYSSLSAGVMPGQVIDHSPVVTIGDHVLIGKGSGIVGHNSVEIGDHVFTGHHVYITDANHGYEDRSLPIGRQFAPTRPVRVGSGSWLGHGTVVLPGADIGRNVAVGAGSVVTGALPDFSVAVGNPARVIRRFVEGEGWVKVDHPVGDG